MDDMPVEETIDYLQCWLRATVSLLLSSAPKGMPRYNGNKAHDTKLFEDTISEILRRAYGNRKAGTIPIRDIFSSAVRLSLEQMDHIE